MLKPLAITNAGEQLRLAYDATHYTQFAADSAGNISITPSGGTLLVNGDLGTSKTNGRIYLDSGAGHSWRANGSDTVDLAVRGSVQFRFQYPVGGAPSIFLPFGNIAVGTGLKLFVDGGVNNYIFSPGSNIVAIVANGNAVCYFRGDTGSLQFGVFTAQADAPVVGTVLIQTLDGTSRKVAVVA